MGKQSSDNLVACFGEVLLRLSTPDAERFSQTKKLDINIGGAECNVAINLSALECSTLLITTLSDNVLGDYALQQLRKNNVSTAYITRSENRMGTYYLESGAPKLQSKVTYDRKDSCFSLKKASDFIWDETLIDCSALHFSGINLALSDEIAKSTINAAKYAKSKRKLVCFDSNFRPSLWKDDLTKAKELIRSCLKYVTIAFLTERDIELIFDLPSNTDQHEDSRLAAYATLFEEYPNIKWLASTYRQYDKFGRLSYKGLLAKKEEHWFSHTYNIPYVIDRIGTGDAFAAGIIFGLINKHEEQYCVDFATALATAKHSIKGDYAALNTKTVIGVMNDNNHDVER